MKQVSTIIAFALTGFISVFAQDEIDSLNSDSPEKVTETFHSTRIINGHSIETLRKGVLEFRVEHRFGDIAGTDGGVQNMFGLDNSSDIRIALEYGLTDQMMIGIGRSKGTGNPYRSLLDGFYKLRAVDQAKGGFPVSVAMIGTTSFSYMKKSEDISQVSNFPEWSHRLAYSVQVNIARKFHDRFSAALMPTMVHRNYVPANDVNTLFALGGAMRVGVSSTMAVLFEYYHVFAKSDLRTNYTNSFGLAFEWITFGHNFTVHLTNSKGFGETQFIPYTFEDWMKGQFRLGFCIGRKFEKG